MGERPHHQQPESWGDKASDYEELFLPLSEAAAALAIERAGVASGQRFLDVAAGTGAMTRAALRAGADVVATDFSPGMLERLDARLEGGDRARVTTRVMDGQALDFEDASFDAAGSSFGLIFFPDPGAGLRELRRVLRPGGPAAIVAMGMPPRSRLMQLIMASVTTAAPDWRPAAPPAFPALAERDAMTAALDAAGLSEAAVEVAAVDWPIADAGDFWRRWALDSPPTRAMMSSLDDAGRAEGERVFVELLGKEFGAGAVAIPTDVVIGVARA